MKISDSLECVLVDEDNKCFSIQREGREVLSFKSSSQSTNGIVYAFQNRVLSILLALHECSLRHHYCDLMHTDCYEVKDSYRDYWEVKIQKTNKVITDDEDGYYEFTYTIVPKFVNDSKPFIEGKFTYHANYFHSAMLNQIIFDIQNQVSKMTVKLVFEHSQQ